MAGNSHQRAHFLGEDQWFRNQHTPVASGHDGTVRDLQFLLEKVEDIVPLRSTVARVRVGNWLSHILSSTTHFRAC